MSVRQVAHGSQNIQVAGDLVQPQIQVIVVDRRNLADVLEAIGRTFPGEALVYRGGETENRFERICPRTAANDERRGKASKRFDKLFINAFGRVARRFWRRPKPGL